MPSIRHGNELGHAIGLGQMNLHGFLAREHIHYGSEEGIDFTSIYFYAVAYHAIKASNQLAIERGRAFGGFEDSTYASGEYFDKYTNRVWEPTTQRVKDLFEKFGIAIPTQDDWRELKKSVMEHGIYNQNLQAVPPPGRSPTSTTRRPQSTRLSPKLRSARKAKSGACTTQRRT